MTDPRPADGRDDAATTEPGDAVAARPVEPAEADARSEAAPAPASDERVPGDEPVAPPAPAEPPAETPAVVESAPPRHGNRLVATFWVLFATLIFEVGYIVLIVLLVLLLDGPSVVGRILPQFFQPPFVHLLWVPVVAFAILYEASVLILGRAGRFAYVVASLIVGILVYAVSGQALIFISQHTLGSAQAVATTLESPEIVLIGVLAREVMLWTGFAVGARGTRVRRRDRAARREFRESRRGTGRV